MVVFTGMHWLPLLVATLASFLLGGIWYGPLFGKAWLDAVGKKQEDLGGAARPMIISFFASAASAIAMAILCESIGTDTLVDGLLLGAVVGIGFISAAMASDHAFCGQRFKLWLIQSGYRVTYSLILGAMLTLWR